MNKIKLQRKSKSNNPRGRGKGYDFKINQQSLDTCIGNIKVTNLLSATWTVEVEVIGTYTFGSSFPELKKRFLQIQSKTNPKKKNKRTR